ncbi:MAG: fructose-bisphosphate aldolase, partial [Candidatus Heimdallarchaeota archaeon]|nr:fructose-bisphosphate aldolase [Candidatus Heimdallarchaeota archaeon]
LIVHLSGSTNLSPKSTFKISTGSVLEACKLGADAISCHVNIGVDNDFEMIENMSKFTTEANNYGIPVLAMMYVRNNVGIDNNNPDALAHAARIAEESGADIVKINMTPNIKDFDEVLQGMGIPVVVAGGSRMDNFDEFISRIKYSIISGATGISIGRNIFQSNDPSKAMSSIKEAVIEGLKETDRYENFSNS